MLRLQVPLHCTVSDILDLVHSQVCLPRRGTLGVGYPLERLSEQLPLDVASMHRCCLTWTGA